MVTERREGSESRDGGRDTPGRSKPASVTDIEICGCTNDALERGDTCGQSNCPNLNLTEEEWWWASPSAGQVVTIRGREYRVQSVDGDGGIYARLVPGDGSDSSDHYWPPGTDWAGQERDEGR